MLAHPDILRSLGSAILLMAFIDPTAGKTERFSIGGTTVTAEILGQAGPTVVFESGLGEGRESWHRVAASLSSCMRVLTYDRPGTGESGPRRQAVALAETIASELEQLLTAASLPPPYILVGHSLGGLYVQAYARRYPQKTAAVILVDAVSPYEPPGVFVSTTPPALGTTAAAEEAGIAQSTRDLLGGPAFPPVPLYVLVATDHNDTPEREALWRSVQERTAAMSPNSRMIVVEGSGHHVQRDRPAAIVSAIVEAAGVSGADVSRCSILHDGESDRS